MGTLPFNCRRCGHCCLTLVDAFAGCVSEADLDRWRGAGRLDILSRIESLDLGRGNVLHLAWVDPLTRDDVERCPWLSELPDGGGFGCTIEAIKPDHCRAYPEDESHARQTGCPGAAPPLEN